MFNRKNYPVQPMNLYKYKKFIRNLFIRKKYQGKNISR